MKRVILLGSSGSIGQSTCKVARALKDRVQLVGLAVQNSTDVLLEQVKEFSPVAVAVTNPTACEKFKTQVNGACKVFSGNEGLVQLVEEVEADMVLVAIVGTAGLQPALTALEKNLDLAVASKEILVMAGESVMGLAAKKKRNVLPVDSEHNAIYQCLHETPGREVRRLILTASGGPFRKTPAEQFPSITVAQALKHPTWSMGKKITIDSATLFNKGLEMIEARWLFGIEMKRIDVIVHPESLVHSMVEFIDHSVLAQLSHSDMCFPIQYAVTWPERIENDLKPMDFAALGKIHFEAPDPVRFPALRLAREAGERGGTLPAVLNAANEVVVEKFLQGSIPFPRIWETVEAVMQKHRVVDSPPLADIVEADHWARRAALEALR